MPYLGCCCDDVRWLWARDTSSFPLPNVMLGVKKRQVPCSGEPVMWPQWSCDCADTSNPSVTSVHSSLHGYFWHMNINPADDSLEPFKKVFFNQFWLWVIAVVWVLIWPGIRNVHNLILSPAKFYSDNICMDLNDSQMYLIVISICHCMDLQWNTKAITMINCSGDQFNHFLWSFYFPYLTSLSLT